MMASTCCGRKEEPAILISRFLLRMRRMYVARIRLDFHGEWMESTERNLIMRVLTNCHMKLTQSTAIDQSVLTFDRCRPHSVTFSYYK